MSQGGPEIVLRVIGLSSGLFGLLTLASDTSPCGSLSPSVIVNGLSSDLLSSSVFLLFSGLSLTVSSVLSLAHRSSSLVRVETAFHDTG